MHSFSKQILGVLKVWSNLTKPKITPPRLLSKNVRQIVAMEEEARGERWGKWKQLPQASSEFQPERRQAHTAVGFGGYSVFLFGGHTDQGLCPSDLWFISCGTLRIPRRPSLFSLCFSR